MALHDILEFYRRRGYGHAIGAGSRPALLVIDFSRAFTGGAGAFPGGDFAAELAATARLLAAARPGIPVFFTTIAYAPDLHEAGWWAHKVPWLRTCRSGSPLVAIDPVLDVQPQDQVIVKHYPSAFFGTGLHAALQQQGVDTLLLAGCTTSVCVRASALDAMQHGYRTLVVQEAVGDFDAAIHTLHLADIGARYCDVVALDDMLTYLRDRRRAPATVAPACPA